MSDTRQVLRETRDRVAPPRDLLGSLDRRRRHVTNVRRATAAALGIVVALAGLGGWFAVQGEDSERTGRRTEELGIFAPTSGWIAFRINRGHGPGIWAVEPLTSDDPAREPLYGVKDGTPIAWTSDGTELLIIRDVQEQSLYRREIVISHADGTETLVVSGADVGDASISPDGGRVVYTSLGFERPPSGLYVIDADGGSSEVLVDSGGSRLVTPTFSPDGTRIAYVDKRRGKHRVWVVNADGSDPHVIVTETAPNHAAVSGLAWSPTGDSIALGVLRTDARGHVREASVFTFAPDGSRFTRVIENGGNPTWSPDGSRIAFSRYRRGDADLPGVIGIVDADGTGLEYVSANAGPGVWHPGS